MAYLEEHGYTFDVFVSYGRIDDDFRKIDDEDGEQGWVAALIDHVERNVQRRAGESEPPSLFLDKRPEGYVNARVLNTCAVLLRMNSNTFINRLAEIRQFAREVLKENVGRPITGQYAGNVLTRCDELEQRPGELE
jgi:hypothetical protein